MTCNPNKYRDGLSLLKGSSSRCTNLPLCTAEEIVLTEGPETCRFPPNHLAGEKSPYLRQHARNPVDWYPWGAVAFRRASEEDKPVFLSIGYSTCHWCHVMARESFCDERIASLLNGHFIAVKVDREERPDIDSVYMDACVRMTGQGGWPLTIIMTPEREPFFAGTYLPPKGRPGMTGLDRLLQNVIRIWKDHHDDLRETAGEIAMSLKETAEQPEAGSASESILRDGFGELASAFDPVNGGFGRAPKFPSPATIQFLLRYWKRTGSPRALFMAEKTLQALSYGGIHDQLGGGFHRYSTDAGWRIPHFEKMLPDQALLLQAFTEAWLATKNPLYRKTAEDIIAYVTRDLLSPEGAFISAEDADSPGGEGAGYLWTLEEVMDALGKEDGQYAAAVYGITGKGNFTSAEQGPGKNILSIQHRPGDDNGDPARLMAIRGALYRRRKERPPPGRDDKILTDWNALMIGGLATASRAFFEPAFSRQAETAARFILGRMRMPDGGLYHCWCDGEASVPAFAGDYAGMIRALAGLFMTTFETQWLAEALGLERYLAAHFADPGGGGFFTVSETGEQLVVRKKEIRDGALPSANSLMLGNLVILGHLTGDPSFEERASSLAGRFAGTVGRSPSAYCAYLCGLDHLLGPATDVVIAGSDSDPPVCAMLDVVRENYLPSCTIMVRSSRTAPALDTLAPFTGTLGAVNGIATAYVCTGRACSAPVNGPEELRRLLGIKKDDG